MRRIIISVLAFLAIALAAPVTAQSNAVLVELYTSQGCSSCPPADELLKKLDKRDNVIALALHVDYWDYLGWKDEFANPEFTKRQKSYAYMAGVRTVYTPQMVIGGVAPVVGHQEMEVADLINEMKVQDFGVRLALRREGDAVVVKARMLGRQPTPMIVQLVRYDPLRSVAITRGENAGKTIEYVNIVTEWNKIGEWDGSGELSLSANVSGPQPVVVILQAAGPGQVFAAARLR